MFNQWLFVIGSVSQSSAHCLIHTEKRLGKKENCFFCTKIDWKKCQTKLEKHLDELLANTDKTKTLRYQRHIYDESQKSYVWLPAYTKSSIMEIKEIIKHASKSIKNYSWHYLAKLQWDKIQLPGYLHTGQVPPRTGLSVNSRDLTNK